MILHSNITGSGPTLVILHGLFGSWENWGSQIRKLAPQYQVIGLDLRNHGESDHADHMSYKAMANDVLETLVHLHVEEYHLIGHSMGGKVAMTLAGQDSTAIIAEQLKLQPDAVTPKLNKLIIVDIAPRTYAPHHEQILTAMQGLNVAALTTRAQADNALQEAIPDLPVRQFILKNLQRSESGGYHWQLNLPVIAHDYHELLTMPKADFTELQNPLLVLRGSESDYVSITDEPTLTQRFPNLQIISIEGAGHWPHASHAVQVHTAISNFLSSS